MKIVLLAFFLLPGGPAIAETAPAQSVAQPAAMGPGWWVNGRGGLYLKSSDREVESKWEHQTWESYLINLGFYRKFNVGPVFFLAGGELVHGESIDQMSSALGTSKIIVQMNVLAPMGAFGWQPPALMGWGGYLFLSLPLLGWQDTTLRAQGFERKIKSEHSPIGFGAAIFYDLNQRIVPMLTIEGRGETVITLGLAYGI